MSRSVLEHCGRARRIPRAAVVVLDAGKVLIIKRYLRHNQANACVMCDASQWRGPDCRGHHYAVLPGCHVEAGETPEDAALRELVEETTLTAQIDRLLWTGSHNGRAAHYFLMTDLQGTAEMSGSEAAHSENNTFELLWVDVHSLSSQGIHPAEVQARLAELIGA
jgi:ADP-ribose pyrophosphatase YjhB (NUDIX family)